MRKGVLFAAFLVLALAIISTVFSILTATSPRWAVQKYYRGMLDKTTFTTVICAAHRSPFYRCGLPRVAGDSPCEIPSCRFYPPSGRNRTSCRVDAEVGAGFLRTATLNGTLGTYMECQEGQALLAAQCKTLADICSAHGREPPDRGNGFYRFRPPRLFRIPRNSFPTASPKNRWREPRGQEPRRIDCCHGSRHPDSSPGLVPGDRSRAAGSRPVLWRSRSYAECDPKCEGCHLQGPRRVPQLWCLGLGS